MKLHPKITLKRVEAAVAQSMCDTSNPGFCIYCGAETESIEPDAGPDPCESCGRKGAYGAEQILMMIF